MKIRNKVISFVFAFVLMLSLAIPVCASNIAVPYYNNMNSFEESFVISESGMATASFACIGYRGITTKITVYTVIQMISGFDWVVVGDAFWIDETTEHYCANEYSIQVNSRGNYKATFIYSVSGSGGEDDVVIREIQLVY